MAALIATACGGGDGGDPERVIIERLDLAEIELSVKDYVDPPFTDQYPDVVATVNGEEITGLALASRQVLLEMNLRYAGARLADFESTDPLEEAVDEALLRQATVRLDYKASAEEGAAHVREQQELFGRSGDLELETRKGMEEAARQLGYPSWLAWTTSDEAVETYRISVGLGRLQRDHCDPVPTAEESGVGTTGRDCAAFLEEERSRAEIVYFVRWAD